MITRAVIARYGRHVAPAGFHASLERLCRQCDVMTVSSLCARLRAVDNEPRAVAAVTVDEAYGADLDSIRSAFERHRVRPTLFVTTGFVDRLQWLWRDKIRYVVQRSQRHAVALPIDGRWWHAEWHDADTGVEVLCARMESMADRQRDTCLQAVAAQLRVAVPYAPPSEFAPMGWPDLRRLANDGWEIGSQTITGARLARTTLLDARREIRGARFRLASELGRAIPGFCYPDGDHSAAIRAEVTDAGHNYAVTCDPGLVDVDSDAWMLNRVTALDADRHPL